MYYVYAYLDPRKPGKYVYGDYEFEYEPFYVGKGKKSRYLYHLSDNYINPFKINKINKIRKVLGIDPIIIKIRENMKESEAYELESYLIQSIGKIIDGNGSLTNMCNVGDFKIRTSKEFRKKLSDRNKGKNNPNYGKSASEKTKIKISKMLKDFYSKEKNKNLQRAISPVKSIVFAEYMLFQSVSEAARILEVDRKTIRNYINDNKPGYFYIKKRKDGK